MIDQTGSVRDHQGLFVALKGLLTTLLVTGRTRLELLATEAEEEKLRVIDLLVCTSAAIFLLALALVLFIACLTLLFWEQRLLVLGACTAISACGGLLFALHLRSRLKKPSALFRTSLREIGKDIASLRSSSERP